MNHETLLWVAFNLVVVALMALDLGVHSRGKHEVSPKDSLLWSAGWMLVALLFNLGIWLWWPQPVQPGDLKPGDAAMQFFTGYLIERALSIDNLFVFIVIFAHFRVRKAEQFKVLFWGIIGALVLRAVFIFGGAAIIHRFEWTIFLFGAFLVYTGIRLALEKNKEIEVENNPIIKFLNRHLRTTDKYHGGKYFVKIDGKRFATPLVTVLAAVAVTDLVFALDSIPAIFAVTRDTFIVYSSNIFAVLGLRALYFAVSELVQKFHLLAYGLAVVLVFVGAKMLLQSVLEIGVAVSLFVVVGVLVAAVVASLLWPAKKGAK